jgi:hypothetical protein
MMIASRTVTACSLNRRQPATGGGLTVMTSYIFISSVNKESRDTSVGTELRYVLDDQGSMVRFSAEAGNFSPHHRVQNGSGAHPASYPMGIWGVFPGGKAAGA